METGLNKNFFFLSGLPRSGSTLLANLLAQNKSIHVSGTSGILEMCLNVRNHWPKITEFQALDPQMSTVRRIGTLRGMIRGYYADVGQNVVIDKNRQWPAHMEMAETIFECKPKVIVTVRDVRDVLASFERKWRETKADTQVSQEEANIDAFRTVAGRCRVLTSSNQVVGSAVVAIVDAVARGWRSHIHFVDYDKLCADPLGQVGKIYNFLELDGFGHDDKNVSASIPERDDVYGWKNLHAIRAVIQPQEPQWPKYIPEIVADEYKNDARFWESL